MEIIETDNNTPHRRRSGVNGSNIYLGSTLVVAGVLWMLYNLHLISYCFFYAVFSWEALVLVVGGYILSTKRWAAGAIVIAAGALLLLSEHLNLYIPVGKIILPCVLIALGIALFFPRK